MCSAIFLRMIDIGTTATDSSGLKAGASLAEAGPRPRRGRDASEGGAAPEGPDGAESR